ncbi:TIGR03086 family protein [Streptomyces sp. ISL-22]|uniref:TIGR03086 family metal-binding protein n=1 Tax=unclassified Streptomyces TaxID=2593676 RepID=UPI001BE9763C|nr:MULTISPECIES: TIGR03086 family metal-binding protein [unclassified Streptomyces]MBT2419091.1 TIGR03086 family protein [Streptomyces sp. ISL-24]MBT2431186.1 TIGR03086 family protein [Streptomyces sp. ISL-22]
METKHSAVKSHTLGDLLAVARERAVPVVRGIPDEALAAPTPCADYDVKALVNHLFQVVVEFQKLAAKGESDFSSTPDRVGAGPDWRERFADETARLVAAWSAPGAEEGTAGAWQMPARLVGSMALLDLTVHVWDLARATGQGFRPDEGAEPVLEQLAGTVAELAPTARATGVFGEPVQVGEGASAWERLLAQTGRDPYWGRAGGDEVAE